MNRLAHPLRPLALAAGMLTVVRVRVPGSVTPAELRASTALYPLVGLGVGLLPAAILLLPFPILPGAAAALAVWVVITGALHLDGWADSCDAAFAPARADADETRARRLAILKDPHVGVFGTAGVSLLLLAKWSALVHVPAVAPVVAAPLARWVMVYALRRHPPARPDGLGASMAGDVRLLGATGVTAAILVALLLVVPLRAALGMAVVSGALAGVLVTRLLMRRFGGLTGDVCGAAGEATELVVLFAFVPWGGA